jgi:cytidine deaminase
MDIDAKTLEKLKSGLDLCILKPADKERTSSIAITRSGREYVGALIGSDTNLMNISSEQVALAMSTSSSDFPVREIITMVENEKRFTLSPLVLKVMVDYAIRTEEPLKYTVIDADGQVLFENADIESVFPLYNPEPIIISKVKENYSPNSEAVEISKKDMPSNLRGYAILGLKRNFPLYDSASAYGTAVYTSGGNVYYAGRYSSPEKRMNLHSEMAAILSALMAGDRAITAIGIVSSKYPDSPCDMCGVCRQFISEISRKLEISPTLYCFAEKTHEFKQFKIEEYLPDSWTSKNW